jgi:hypothetical protein
LVALLLISIGILSVGIAASVVLMSRSGETRVGFMTLCFALLAARQGIVLWLSWDAPLVLDATGAAEISVFAASIVGLLILAALWQTLSERDRAESLHWNSMEAVRILGELAARSDLNLDEKLDALLKVGCERFDLEVGAVSRVDEQRYEVIAIRGPEGFPVSPGAVLLLADTCCNRALTSMRPVAFERVDDPAPRRDGGRPSFGFRTYLGGSVRVYDEVVGTLCFGGRSPSRRRFTATDKDLLNLMSQWVGTELERSFAALTRKASATGKADVVPAPPARANRRDVRIHRSIDVNAAIRRSEENLRTLIGAGVELDYRLAGDLHAAVALRFTIGAIVESLVLESVEALSAGGRITIETANLEIANGNSDVVPTVAPDHYVTVSVKALGNGIEAESFAQAFDPPRGLPADADGGVLRKRMPIATIYRVLQRCGGDLSIEVEPGKASTFTVFLPHAAADAPAPRPSPSLASPVEQT